MKEKKKLTIGGIFSQIVLLILAVILIKKRKEEKGEGQR